MDVITLKQTLPLVFAENGEVSSGIWNKTIRFEKGQSYILKADSGTGKSSLCSFLYGYRTDYSGEIQFDEKAVARFTTREWDTIRQQQLSLMFQELRLFPELTAMENVLLKNKLTGFKPEPDICDMFDRLGIADRREFPTGKMSWGQQQRVAVIRALCQPFDFLILDEPVSHLDETNALLISQLVSDEIRRQGAGLIVTSIGQDLPITYSKTYSL